jgi:hypothetical protein
MPNLFFVVGSAIGVSPRDYFHALWRPMAAAGAMGAAILAANAVLPFDGLFRLMLDVMLGAATYIGAMLGLWRLCGQPDTPEKDVTAFLQSRLIRYSATIRGNALAPSSKAEPLG